MLQMFDVRDDPKGAEHIMRLRRALGRNDAFEDDLGRLINGEFSAFDEIGEISFEEGERRIGLTAARRRSAVPGDAVAQRDHQARSEERRVGKACVSTCRSRGSTSHYKKKRHSHETAITNTHTCKKITKHN